MKGSVDAAQSCGDKDRGPVRRGTKHGADHWRQWECEQVVESELRAAPLSPVPLLNSDKEGFAASCARLGHHTVNSPFVRRSRTVIPRDARSSGHPYQPGCVGGPGRFSGGGSGCSSSGFRIRAPNGRSSTKGDRSPRVRVCASSLDEEWTPLPPPAPEEWGRSSLGVGG